MTKSEPERGLQQALDQERERLESELAWVLSEAARLRAWSQLDLPDDLRAYLETQRARCGARSLEVLERWVGLGGQVGLTWDLVGGATPKAPEPAPVVVAAPEERAVASPTVLASAPPPPPDAWDAGEGDDTVVGRDPQIEEAAPDEAVDDDATPATTDQILALKRRMESGDAQIAEVQRPAWGASLQALLRALAPAMDDHEDLARITAAVARCQAWTAFPRDVQRSLVGLCAARLRRLQDDEGVDAPELRRAFAQLTRFSAEAQPGYVRGLQRDHRPVREAWEEDADAYYEDLLDALGDDEPAPTPNREKLVAAVATVAREVDLAPAQARGAVIVQALARTREALGAGVGARDPGLINATVPLERHLDGREFRALRRAIRDSREADPETAADETHPPERWPWWDLVRGRRALMVGGSPREPSRQALEAYFELGALEWVEASRKTRALSHLADRIGQGRYDIVFILNRFVGHDTDDILVPACRAAGVALVHVERGYGAARVQRAIERFLEP